MATGDTAGSQTWGETSFRDSRRGQSVVVGTILMFALGVALLGVLQVTVIPSANEEVEAKHSQQVRGQMQDLRNDIQRSASDGGDFSQGVKVGTDYPARAFFLNPGPSAGSISTQGTDDTNVDINIRNAQATGDEAQDFWDGTSKDFDTGAVVYRPKYNIYSGGPEATVVENSLVYNRFEDTPQDTILLAADQQIVEGKEISLVALDGELFRSQVNQYTVDTNAVSASGTEIPVTDTGSSIEIDVSTKLPEKVIVGDVLAGQIDDSADGGPGLEDDDECKEIDPDPSDPNERYISGCSFSSGPEFNTLTLTFESSETYTLELSKIGVGTGYSSTSAAYITEINGEGASVAETGTLNLVVEVRDKFNNPVPGETVELSLPDTNDGDLGAPSQDTVTRQTDETGQVEVTYFAPSKVTSSPRGVEVEATYDVGGTFNEDDPEDALIQLQAINGSQINRASPLVNPTDLVLEEALIRDDSSDGEKCPGSGNPPCQVDITFRDPKDDGEPVVLDEVRYSFYSSDAAGTSSIDAHGETLLTDESVTLEFAGEFEDIDTTIPDDGEKTLSFKFRDASGSPAPVNEGDFFVISFIVDDERVTYFIPPKDDP